MITSNDLYVCAKGSRSGSVTFIGERDTRFDSTMELINQEIQKYLDAGGDPENLPIYYVKNNKQEKKLQRLIQKANSK